MGEGLTAGKSGERAASTGMPPPSPLWCVFCTGGCDWCPADDAFPQESAEKLQVASDWCSQCGQRYDAPACGPTHAVIAAERDR